jgi:pyruvate,water dikinase
MVWGALLIFIVCPLLGGVPLIRWIIYALTRQNLARLGTGNVSVSAAFYHGGNIAGILAVLSEAGKGIAAVLLARGLFPSEPAWELIALIALVAGRYWVGRGAGTTNVVWGFVVHDWRVALFVFLIGGVGFTIWREKQQGRLAILVLVCLMVVLLHPHEPGRIIGAIALCSFIAGIYQKIPDDLDLRPEQASTNTQPVFRFFRGDKALISLDTPLDANKVGQKAATLSQLTRWGYPVPTGWVLAPGDDPAPLIESVEPSEQEPLVVRSSAIGEDSEYASAAGQYESILNVTSKDALQEAINGVLASYDNPAAVQYRRDRDLPEDAIAVLIQKQVQGVFSGVAFSRDPISQQGDAVIIEGLPGYATSVVSGQVTPEQYRVFIPKEGSNPQSKIEQGAIAVEGTGDLPPALIKQVAILARDLEARYHGVPQDIEWSYDGRALWLLQSRPITTLLPIWTRKIAAEVIPGLIRPLTWSINRPLTCGVWGEIYTLVLGKKARGLDFNETATLHYSRAYFNATLLGQIFRRMGLPPESLEFLTLGAKFSKPPLGSTLRNVPGLMRLMGRELSLEKDFQKDYKRLFAPILSKLASKSPSTLSPLELLERVDEIHSVLKQATYYSIMAPLSAALRQAIWRVKDTELDNSQSPEVASLRSLQELAADARNLIPNSDADLFANQSISDRFDQFLERYGYLSQVGTDIAVPTWKEEPHVVKEMFAEFFKQSEPHRRGESRGKRGGKVRLVQGRLNLKGRVTEVYSRLLAELRWCFVALENVWLDGGLLAEPGDIFFLEFSEIRHLVAGGDEQLSNRISQVQQRRDRLEEDRNLDPVPPLVYGNAPPASIFNFPTPSFENLELLQGIGASPGQVEGRVKVLRNLQSIPDIDRDTILVVPYTDSGWAPLLARAGGLIAEVGGRLSHGAIVAREYGIPAVMDIHNATQILQDGQRVRIDGSRGIVEIL